MSTETGDIRRLEGGDLPNRPQIPLIMGIINATPDSFSDGGEFLDATAAIEHGRNLIADGASILDIGGESTRPGSKRVSEDEECARVLPVVAALAKLGVTGVMLSADTMRANVARLTVGAGATIVNDVSGGLADPEMLSTVAELGCDYVIQHWRGHGASGEKSYVDVVAEVKDALLERVDAALATGIAPERIIIDPGIGFGKSRDDDWTLVAQLSEFTRLGYRVLLGASRKRFLAEVCIGGQPSSGEPVGGEPRDRDVATAAVSLLAADAGVWSVRVHNVLATAEALAVAGRIRRATRADDVCQPPPSVCASTTISITGLEAKGYHGVFAHERDNGQPFIVDLQIEVRGCSNDDLAETLDYGIVCEQVASIIAGEPVNLIETLANRIADTVLAHGQVLSVEVCVHKPMAPVTVSVSDIAVRLRKDASHTRVGQTVDKSGR